MGSRETLEVLGQAETAMATDERAPRLTGSVPTLDFDETIAFYARLGFSVTFRDLGLIGLERDGVRLHFWLTGNRRIPQSSSCWIDVAGIEALYAMVEPLKIVHRRGRLETKPW